jgi:hypothetical protein
LLTDALFDASAYSSEARALRILLEKNKKLQESVADILSVLRRPSSGDTSGMPTLALPDTTQDDQHMKRNRRRPGGCPNKGSPLADLQALMSHLKVLVTRLEGDSPSPARLSPWLLKHVRSSSSLKLLAQKPMMGLAG